MGQSPKEVAVFPEQMKLLLVCVNKVYKTMPTYDAARYSWPVKPEKAQQAKFVMAVFRGVIVGVFEADEWLPANEVNFSDLPPGHGNWHKQEAKFGFVGHPARKDIEQLYRDRAVPTQWRFTGNSIRYVNFG
jgi:hypothetical protein